jgi:hypothetical protein
VLVSESIHFGYQYNNKHPLMGEFYATVSTLLEAFGKGITIIRSLRRRRKESKAEIDSAVKADESRLSKSLKKNRIDVRSAYKAKLERLGRQFADGDGKPPEMDRGFSPFTSFNAVLPFH